MSGEHRSRVCPVVKRILWLWRSIRVRHDRVRRSNTAGLPSVRTEPITLNRMMNPARSTQQPPQLLPNPRQVSRTDYRLFLHESVNLSTTSVPPRSLVGSYSIAVSDTP